MPQAEAQLDAINGSCFTTDVGEAMGVAAYNGKHLVDECCATCNAATLEPHCAKCLADGHSRTACAAIGVCNCYPQACRDCLRAADAGKLFTLSECMSYGFDCTEDCSATAHHRRTQSGTSAAVQVKAGKQSSAQLTAVLDCVASGGNVTKCADDAMAHG